jgi:hypothetical protein
MRGQTNHHRRPPKLGIVVTIRVRHVIVSSVPGSDRLCVGVVLSQIYAQVFGTRGQPDVRRPDRGDGYDVWHAILASTADVFVTLDGRLADHVERIPDVENLRVLRSVKALLAAIA